MTNENETIEHIHEEMNMAQRVMDEGVGFIGGSPYDLSVLANRILAAHKRELEERNKAIKDLSAICRNLLTKDCAGCIRKSCLHFGENVLCVEHEDLLNKIKEAEDLANG